MKKHFLLILVILLLLPSALALEVPKPYAFVNDYANVIDDEQEAQLNQVLSDIEKNTTVEIAILTLPTLEKDSLEDFSYRTAKAWGIGKEDKDNGLLIVLVTDERLLRLEVGYGLEGTIPDLRAKQIAEREMYPSFKDGEYGQGMINGVSAIQGFLENNPEVVSKYSSATTKRFFPSYVYAIAILIIVLSLILGLIFKKAKMAFGGIAFIADIALFTFSLTLAFIFLYLIVTVLLTTRKIPGNWYHGSGGFGGGVRNSGFGGSFSGFGGGSFGGGGFSGRF